MNVWELLQTIAWAVGLVAGGIGGVALYLHIQRKDHR